MVRVLVMLGILLTVIALIDHLYLHGFDVIGLW